MTISVLVVDDDFRVAAVHAGFVSAVPGFTVAGTANTAATARSAVAEWKPDLMLVDVYLPDESGLRLLASTSVDAIVLSAANDPGSFAAASRAGALNYLVKPFTAAQLSARLTAYARYRSFLDATDELAQQDIDRAIRALHENDRSAAPKGQSLVTARLVSDALRAAGGPRSATEISAELGIARATAQRYLGALADNGSARIALRYGVTGRPEHEYTWDR